MIKIIAVHPDVMSTPEGIREYLKDFGTGKGRWIPLVPSNWKSIVSQAIKGNHSLGPIKRNTLRDKITNPSFCDKYLKVDLVDGDGREWGQIVKEFCDLGTFDAAIVNGELNAGEKSLKAYEFDPDSDLYAVRISGFVSRDPEELARQVAPGLRFAKELHVIDVYCKSRGTNCASYGKFFRGLLDTCRQTNPALTSITLHMKEPDDFDRRREEANYRSWVSHFLRSGETLKIRYLKERQDGERMHLRAVFTDNLLITGHYGFGSGSSESETTDLTLREHSDLIAIRNLYLSDDKIGFDLMEQIEIGSNS
ncbi:hypothetical protein HZ994_02180 [Akkermansiaceae bacterium]|nr:hypothetical protein HZ994_02180 [Akkermansiaceae bacterium]